MKNARPLSVCLSLLLSLPALAADRIWPDPGASCRPALVRLAAGQEVASVSFSAPRRFDFPSTLSISNAAVDSPRQAIVRFKQSSGVWQHCVYALDPESRRTYGRTGCSTSSTTGLELQLAQVEAVLPKGESVIHVALQEPTPCAATPRSYDKLTVGQGGRFFPKDNPESSRWVAVLDERLVSEGQLNEVANGLASQYGVSILNVVHGPYGFSFEGNYEKAKNLAFNNLIRFVESDVDYFGFGYVDSKLPLQGSPDSWALDRLDQRESLFETSAFVGGTSAARDSRYRYPETVRPLASRPRVFVVDNKALVSHDALDGFPATNIATAGGRAQCQAGQVKSAHGTQSLAMLVGRAGIVRSQPRQTLQIWGLARMIHQGAADVVLV